MRFKAAKRLEEPKKEHMATGMPPNSFGCGEAVTF
jgi:hypothetical protein